ncbi:hypothetical protein HY030_04215 [Candidatus Gottesmanbacteria bacterium]|nr:hypothetical protein [Candidatus Gottesmanbacteria bacterium]
MIKKAVIKKKLLHFLLLLFVMAALLSVGVLFGKPVDFKSLNFGTDKLFNPAKNNNYLILVNQLAKEQIDISYLNYLDNDTVEASLTSGVKVIFSLKKEPISLVTSLQLILSRFRIEGRKVSKIDLRFKNPVVE